MALWQLRKVRGETKVAREAAEEAQRLVKRETTGTDLTRLDERIQGLIYLLRNDERDRALDRFPEVRNLFIEIRRHHPALMAEHRSQIQEAISTLRYMQNELEALPNGIPAELRAKFNDDLTDFQTSLIVELEDRLQ